MHVLNDFLASNPGVTVEIDAEAAQLATIEVEWRDKQAFLQSKGYMLRPRLCPGWIPSWTLQEDAAQMSLTCEDYESIPPRANSIDAVRISDGRRVYIKRVTTDSPELYIATLLPPDPRNHCIPILDRFIDNEDGWVTYLVMPLLRRFDDPPFSSVADVIDFVNQLGDGLSFLHENYVAHGDCSYNNIMMDADYLYPNGFHPVKQNYDSLASHIIQPLSRSGRNVKYYFIDYGISTAMGEDAAAPKVWGRAGRDQSAPELLSLLPYNPFPVDVYVIGNLLRTQFYEKYSNIDFLKPLIEKMTHTDPHARLRAYQIYIGKYEVSWTNRMSRLRPRGEMWLIGTVLYVVTPLVNFGKIQYQLYKWLVDLQG